MKLIKKEFKAWLESKPKNKKFKCVVDTPLNYYIQENNPKFEDVHVGVYEYSYTNPPAYRAYYCSGRTPDWASRFIQNFYGYKGGVITYKELLKLLD